MQTQLGEAYKDLPAGQRADAILRRCVHCGFCNATCPTYQLLGDELDGPRGRIYLIKSLLEGEPSGPATQVHLDRCLGCRACETTCPSGVEYHHLLDFGRSEIERQVRRPFSERVMRKLLRTLLPHPQRFRVALRIGRLVKALLPAQLAAAIPPAPPDAGAWPAPRHRRQMLVHRGCVQPALAPAIDAAAARVFDRLGITPTALNPSCCGAISQHLGAEEEARDFARRNIDTWGACMGPDVEGLLVTASGCGAMMRDYGRLLADDPDYAQRAGQLAALVRDPAEVLEREDLTPLDGAGRGRRLALHAPCTLTHALRLAGATERVLRRLGYELTRVADPHLCCGSAGTYSLLQPAIARPLLEDKVAKLEADRPELIATANIGCQTWIGSRAAVPVRHWIEVVDESCDARRRGVGPQG